MVQWLTLEIILQGARVQSLVGKLRSYILCGAAKKKLREKDYLPCMLLFTSVMRFKGDKVCEITLQTLKYFANYCPGHLTMRVVRSLLKAIVVKNLVG